MCTDKGYIKKTLTPWLYGPFLWTGLTSLKLMCHYWTVDYSSVLNNLRPSPPPAVFYLRMSSITVNVRMLFSKNKHCKKSV